MKHTAAFVIFGLLFALLSCGSPPGKDEKDTGLSADSVIPEKKFISMLVDVHLLEGGLTMLRNKGDEDRKWNHDAYRKLFLKYNVTQNQFVRNLSYYAQDSRNYTKIYDTVLFRLNKLKAEPVRKN